MLFRKKIERSCSYCLHGVGLEDGMVLCAKKGVKSMDDKCRKFKYDPCKRTPPRAKAPNFRIFDEDDFSL